MSSVYADAPQELAMRKKAHEANEQDKAWAQEFAATLLEQDLQVVYGVIKGGQPSQWSYQLPNFFAAVMTVEESAHLLVERHPKDTPEQAAARQVTWSDALHVPSYTELHGSRQHAIEEAVQLSGYVVQAEALQA